MKKLTVEWRRIALSISDFLLNVDERNNLPVSNLYNNWASESNINIQDDELFDWALRFIADMRYIDRDILRDAILLDI